MNQIHRDLDVQFAGSMAAMIEELQGVFAERLGVTWMPHPEEVESLLEKFSAQTLLEAMRALGIELRIRREDPKSFLEDELLVLLEEKAGTVEHNRIRTKPSYAYS